MFIVSETFLWSAWNFITPIFAIFVVRNIQNGTLQIAASVSLNRNSWKRILTEIFVELLSIDICLESSFSRFIYYLSLICDP